MADVTITEDDIASTTSAARYAATNITLEQLRGLVLH